MTTKLYYREYFLWLIIGTGLQDTRRKRHRKIFKIYVQKAPLPHEGELKNICKGRGILGITKSFLSSTYMSLWRSP